MPFYKDASGALHSIEDERFSYLLPVGAIEISDDEARVLQEPPPPTTEQLIAVATMKRDELLNEAALRIAPLQDAVDLGIASNEEMASLTAWKQYRVALNRIDQQASYPVAINWPDMNTANGTIST